MSGLTFDFLFAWLPPVLRIGVMGVLGVAFLIIFVKVLIALVEIISKVIFLFVP